MDVVVKSLKGNCQLSGIQPYITIQEFKAVLQERFKTNGWEVPAPDNQRLIYKDNVLADGTLQDAGLATGDSIVLIVFKEHVPKPEPDPAPVPDAAAISAAIREEAKRQGIEHQLTEEVPPRRVGHNLTGTVEDMDQRLMQLVEALEGRLSLLRNREDAAAGEEAAPAPEAQEPLQVPEPSADAMAQLMDMGFPEAVARKALLLTAGDLAAAADWALQHSDDADAATPPTQEQLRAIYGPRQRGRRAGAQTQADMLATLVEMGFERQEAAAALSQFRSLDLALPALLHQAQQRPPGAVEGAPGNSSAARQEGGEAGTSGDVTSNDVDEEYHEGEGHYDEDSDDDDDDDDDEYVEGAEAHRDGALDSSDDEDMEEIDTEDGVTIDGLPNFGSADMEQILEGMARPEQLAADDLLMHLLEHQARMHEAASGAAANSSQGQGSGSQGQPPASQGGSQPQQ